MGFYQLYKTQQFNQSLDEVWDFISNPANLNKITPTDMNFDILSKNLPKKMYQGLIIKYKVTPLLGIKTNWVTEITHLEEKKFFVDEQRVGPYKIWHHQHHLEANRQGVIMTDIVSYQPPLGVIGNLMNHLIIKKKLDAIFDFRQKALEEIF
ncbi:SRPBCC family protein [Mesonia sp. K7]|uniref:SRPBCC family protein n=1 Tax=Mesonia sp. K7 TaxID=2218606 RepID=UPI000DA7687E|nr:SRPBCC family protein [Mesonia sp. K7]PZD79349.1 hypothetical protein DNG35_02360 [Mesonia sp. K7]